MPLIKRTYVHIYEGLRYNADMTYKQIIIPKISADIPVAVLGDERLLGRELVCIVSDPTSEDLAAYRIGYAIAAEGYVILCALQNSAERSAVEGALEAFGKVVVALPCPLSMVYPEESYELINQVVKNGGAVFSPYPTFVEQRNRLMGRICSSLIVIAAEEGGIAEKTIAVAYKRMTPTAMLMRGVVGGPIPKIAIKYYIHKYNNKRTLINYIKGIPDPVTTGAEGYMQAKRDIQ